jgi:hypothetical protein
LIAKAVELSCENKCKYLAYDKYDYNYGGSESLLRFKRNSGFKKIEYPRYFVPLSNTGKLAINLGLQHGLIAALPENMMATVLKARNSLRTIWYKRKYGLKE